MFRPMRRIKQQISDEKCKEILMNEPRGVLSLIGDDGYPYGIPMSHFYDSESGNIYFHGSKAGHKIDAINRSNKVSFCVYDKGFVREGEWALNINSVVVFGKINIIEDYDKKVEILNKLSHKFTDDEEYIAKEIETSTKNANIFELVPEHITGKLVNES